MAPGSLGRWLTARVLHRQVLCDRLKDEPEAVQELWDDIKGQGLTVTPPMLDAIFKACQKPEGGGIEPARQILREGTRLGSITQPVRTTEERGRLL